MRIPHRNRFSLGVTDGYASDSAYLTALGSSPRRGDFYFNTTIGRYKFFDGSTWHDMSSASSPKVDLIDFGFGAVPSGPQTIDGVSTSPGMFVILAGVAGAGVYKVTAGVWTAQPTFDGNANPSEGDFAYVRQGTVYHDTFQYFDGSTWRVLNLITEGTVVDQLPRWNGTRYVADPDLLASANTLYTKPSATVDGVQAQDININGGNKTAGTGDGGDVNLSGGTSAGGQIGRVTVTATATTFGNRTVLPTSPVLGDWLLYNSQFRYWDSATWKLIYPLPTGTVDKSILSWDMASQSWLEDAFITASGNTIAGTPDNNNDAFAPTATYLYGSTKTAGTGNGGLLGILGGNSFGGIGGAVQILGGTGPTTRGTVYANKMEFHTDSLVSNDSVINATDDTVVDAFAAANLTVRASNKTAGTGNGGDLFLASGTSFGGLQGNAAITARKIRLNAQASADPSSPLAADVYYNTLETRFKYYDGTNWRPLGSGGGAYPVNYIDIATVSASPPTGAPFAPDGTNVITGDQVLFTALSTLANRGVYRATVTGPTITWSRVIYGQSPTGVSTDGDFVWSQSGSVRADTLWVCTSTAGATWVDYGTSLGGSYANKFLSNLSSPTSVNQALIPDVDNTRDLGTSTKTWSVEYVQILRGSSGADSVGVQARRLADTSGNTSLDWQGRALVFGGGNRLQWGAATIQMLVDQEFLQASTIKTSDGTGTQFALTLRSGNGTGAASAQTGALTLQSGNQTAGSTNGTGAVTLKSGNNDPSGSGSGSMTIATGTAGASTGGMTLQTGDAGGGASGAVLIKSGVANSGPSSGSITLQSGNGSGSPSGAINLTTGTGTTRGNVAMDAALITSTADFQFTNAADHMVYIQARTSSGAGRVLTLAAGSANGTDQAAGGTIIQTGQSTGTGSAADITFKRSSVAGVSGSSLNALYTSVIFSDTQFTFLSSQGGNQGLKVLAQNNELFIQNNNSGEHFNMAQGKILFAPALWAEGSTGSTAGAPAFTFQNASATGMFLESSTDLGLTVSGTRRLSLTTAGSMMLGTGAGAQAEFTPLASFTLADAQTGAAQTIFSVTSASFTVLFIEYSIVRNGIVQGGLLTISNDGTAPGISDTGSSTGTTGISFSAAISGPNLLIQYNSTATGFTGAMKYHQRRW